MTNFDNIKPVLENSPRVGVFIILSKVGDDTLEDPSRAVWRKKEKEKPDFLTSSQVLVYNTKQKTFSEKGIYRDKKGTFFRGSAYGFRGSGKKHYLPTE